jgi:hypothetical protein
VIGRPGFIGSAAGRFLAIAAAIMIGLAIPTARASAAAPADVLLQAPLIGQQFTPADSGGDYGAYDCLPASLTMAISALQSTTLSTGSGVGSYISVADGSRFAPGETIVVESEHMRILSISPHETVSAGFSRSPDGTSDLYVSRGTDGTTVIAHPAGALVQRPADYGSVRRFMRSVSTVPASAGLSDTYGVVEASTDHLFTADKTYKPTTADQWKGLAETELGQGRPLVLYIANASLLNDSTGQSPRPSSEDFDGAHAVLLVGLQDGGSTVVIDDPWNTSKASNPIGAGRQLRMTDDAFAAAWGSTRFGQAAAWLYIGFRASGRSSQAVASAGPIVIHAPKTTPPPVITQAPKLSPPSAPGNLTALDFAAGNLPEGGSPCYAEDPDSDICLMLEWSPAGGQIDGYRIFVGRYGGSCGTDPTCTLSDWCVDGNRTGVQPEATAPPGATFYDLPLTGEYDPACVAVSAFNAAGESSWTVAQVDTGSGALEPVAP